MTNGNEERNLQQELLEETKFLKALVTRYFEKIVWIFFCPKFKFSCFE